MPAGARILGFIWSAWLCACNLENLGDPPPSGKLYFPNALVLAPAGTDGTAQHLFVANSNFDLRYRGGSVQAYSLKRLDDALANCDSEDACVLDPRELLDSEVLIDAFSTSLAISPDGSKLYVPTRTDTTLTVIEVEVGGGGRARLSCRRDGGALCDSNSERGEDPDGEGARPWPADPVSVVAGPLEDFAPAGTAGFYAAVAHRGGELSLFVERADGAMLMTDVLEGGLSGVTNFARDPETGLLHATAFFSGRGKLLGRIGLGVPERGREPVDRERALLYDAGLVGLVGADASSDTRDIVFVPAFPEAGAAFAEPRALVLSQRPNALFVVDVNPARNARPGVARVLGTIGVGTGASRITYGVMDGRPFAVVSCFGSRELFVVDLGSLQARSVVPNLSGPFELVLDAPRKRLYVADFRSSVIRIVDLAPVLDGAADEAARVSATIGSPQVLQELL